MPLRASGQWMMSTSVAEPVRCFIPAPLPPEPPLQLTAGDLGVLAQAERELGRLDGLSAILPDTSLLVYMYVRKEAVLSSQIEGTQSSLSDLLAHEIDEAPGVPLDDVQEVSNYVHALKYGLDRLRGGFPLSLRLLREIHAELLKEGRGGDKLPGEFRRSQNWIGGTRPGNARYVPPPPPQMEACLDQLERFIHQEEPIPLIKIAMIHAQFESIHPFLDGNGRLGRLLITLMLYEARIMEEPVLYLSLYFKTHRDTYYDLLQRVRTHGDWEGWVRFFLQGVLETAQRAAATARALRARFEEDRNLIQSEGKRSAGSILQLHAVLQITPICSVQVGAQRTGLSEPTVSKGMELLQRWGLVRELTGRQRGRIFCYGPMLDLLTVDLDA